MAGSKFYRLHPLAWEEIEGADDWYLQRSEEASRGFIDAVAIGIKSIAEAPQRWPKYLHGTQRFVLHRFPFSIVYLNDPDALSIVAVAHHKRKPGYWKRRL